MSADPIGEMLPLTARAVIAALVASAAVPLLAAAAALFAWLGDIDRERAALKIFVVEHFHRLVRVRRAGELDEGEPARLAGEFIQHQVHRIDCAGLSEVVHQVAFHGLVRQVADEES